MYNSSEEYLDVMNKTSVDTSMSSVYLAVEILWKVGTPCLLLLGGFGNVATIFVLCRIKNHNSSQHVFLIALAAADLTVLGSYVLPKFLYYFFNIELWILHSVTCKLYFLTKRVSFRLSSWLVTAVTFQRTLAIRWPHKIRVMCTVRRTWTIVAALVVFGSAYYTYLLILYRVGNNKCFYYDTPINQFFVKYIDTWLNMCLNSFLPSVCLLVCDVILSLSLFRATSDTSVANQAISNAPSAQSNNSRRETARRTTVMILVLSISFIILTMPVRIISIIYTSGREMESPMFHLLYRVSRFMVCINSAVNFFLYCFTGTRFRKEFLSWICCRVEGPSSGKTGSESFKGERTKDF